jgi:hypothetical protein
MAIRSAKGELITRLLMATDAVPAAYYRVGVGLKGWAIVRDVRLSYTFRRTCGNSMARGMLGIKGEARRRENQSARNARRQPRVREDDGGRPWAADGVYLWTPWGCRRSAGGCVPHGHCDEQCNAGGAAHCGGRPAAHRRRAYAKLPGQRHGAVELSSSGLYLTSRSEAA